MKLTKLEKQIKDIMENIENRLAVLSEGQIVRENGIAIRELYRLRDKLIPLISLINESLLTSQVEKIREEVVDGYLKSVKENGFVKPSVLVVLYGEAELYLTQTKGETK